MIKRIYIDNFRTLVNFELDLDSINLLLGKNGTGKSSIFHALKSIKQFAEGNGKIKDFFPYRELTKWQNNLLQKFELDIESKEGLYRYELAIEHTDDGKKRRVEYERLLFNDNPLIKFERGNVQLYRDNFSAGPAYQFNWTMSALATILPSPDNKLLTWFRDQLENLIIVQIIPPMMDVETKGDERTPSPHFQNFLSWYQYFSQDQGRSMKLNKILQDALPGFNHFKFNISGEDSRILIALFQDSESAAQVPYRFHELSDGQQMIIALYSLILSDENNGVKPILLIDEPDNFLALSEIQPWLHELFDRATENKLQAVLISHHPEIINYLVSESGILLFRESNRPTRKRMLCSKDSEDLAISELLARDWLNG